MKRLSVLTALLFVAVLQALAQMSGQVVDAVTGSPVAHATISYRGNKVVTTADSHGRFEIARHNGWRLTVSSVGYVPQVVVIGNSTPFHLVVRLKEDNRQLKEVTVSTQRKSKYSRKNNPAVDLMRKVIEQKKHTDLRQHDYYRYTNYQKLMFGLNDLQPEDLAQGIFKKHPWLLDHVEVSQYNDKLTLPLTVEETVTDCLYRREPHSEKNIVQGQQSSGVNDLFQTGDIINMVLKDCFSDVDIYDDNIRLFQYPFVSPIGRDAIQFYRYYITDTTFVGEDLCYQLDFTPNNQQDFGFRGQLFVLADSSYQVKRCEITIPKTSDVNWVDNMRCLQEFTRIETGEWVLTTDDMIVELMAAKFMAKAIVVRTTRRTEFSFDELADGQMKGRSKNQRNAYAEMRGDDFWAKYRQVELTGSESQMDLLVKRLEQLKGFKYVIFGLRALIENFVETGTKDSPSKVDIGPVNTIVSQNFYDKWRLRASAQTTANLNPHWFGKGYYARGMESNENYYGAQLTYSLNKPGYLPREFPRRAVAFESTRDVAMPSDKYIRTDKDNMFTSFKIVEIDKMFLYDRQSLSFDYEQEWGPKYFAEVKTEHVSPVGNIALTPMSRSHDGGTPLPGIRYSEATVGVRYAPYETYINTKQHRWQLNFDAPVVRLQHTVGVKGMLGGQYNYNFTEGEIYKRFWMPMAWGKLGFRLKFGAQWNTVPYPLLIMPVANLGYILEDETFNLINNMEFLNDRYVSLMADWDFNGKIFNRIPLLRKLKWREFVSLKMLWGELTDKNNPMLAANAGSDIVMAFPDGCYVMDKNRPYWEMSLGIHNIFKLLHVEYVRRLTYIGLPTATRHGVRFTFRASF